MQKQSQSSLSPSSPSPCLSLWHACTRERGGGGRTRERTNGRSEGGKKEEGAGSCVRRGREGGSPFLHSTSFPLLLSLLHTHAHTHTQTQAFWPASAAAAAAAATAPKRSWRLESLSLLSSVFSSPCVCVCAPSSRSSFQVGESKEISKKKGGGREGRRQKVPLSLLLLPFSPSPPPLLAWRIEPPPPPPRRRRGRKEGRRRPSFSLLSHLYNCCRKNFKERSIRLLLYCTGARARHSPAFARVVMTRPPGLGTGGPRRRSSQGEGAFTVVVACCCWCCKNCRSH